MSMSVSNETLVCYESRGRNMELILIEETPKSMASMSRAGVIAIMGAVFPLQIPNDH